VKKRLLRWEWLLVALILVMVTVNTQLSPFFLEPRNLLRASSDFIEIGIMMLPMVFIIITGNIDLSVASTLGLAASLLGFLHNAGWPIWAAAAAALAAGALCGLLNGVLIARFGLPSLVVTLGTFSFYRGLAYGLLGDEAARGYPAAFTWLGQGRLPGTRVPVALVLFVALVVVFALVLHRTRLGRYLYAIGNNEDASRYAGAPVRRIKIGIYTLSGFMAALAGLILAARFGSTRPDIGTGLELSVITVTVLGGVSINGGVGSMLGAVLALLLIAVTRFGMGLLNLQGQVQDIAIGLLLILSILLPNLGRWLAARPAPSRGLLLRAGAALLVVAAFGWFFFWSRGVVLAVK
jgi:rhamnose transport system permease protein